MCDLQGELTGNLRESSWELSGLSFFELFSTMLMVAAFVVSVALLG